MVIVEYMVNIQMFGVEKILVQLEMGIVINNCFVMLVYLKFYLEYKVYLMLYMMEYKIIQMVLLVLDQNQIFFRFINVLKDIILCEVEILNLIIFCLMVKFIMEMYFQNQNV